MISGTFCDGNRKVT